MARSNTARSSVALLVAGAALLCMHPEPPLAAAAGAPRPHIVQIVADDLGYDDLGHDSVMGNSGKSSSPNINELMDNGIILSDYYTCVTACLPACLPARPTDPGTAMRNAAPVRATAAAAARGLCGPGRAPSLPAAGRLARWGPEGGSGSPAPAAQHDCPFPGAAPRGGRSGTRCARRRGPAF